VNPKTKRGTSKTAWSGRLGAGFAIIGLILILGGAVDHIGQYPKESTAFALNYSDLKAAASESIKNLVSTRNVDLKR
jgi:hypothetical protein